MPVRAAATGRPVVSAPIRVVKPFMAGGLQRLFWSIRALAPEGAALDA